MTPPLLQVEDLQVEFRTRAGRVPVIRELSLSLAAGETLGIVGESGCGKSMTALSIMRLVPVPPGRIAGGRILFRGEDLLTLPERRMRQLRGNRIGMIFQEPMTSLNPVFTIGDQIMEVVQLHESVDRKTALFRAVEALRAVGIPAPERRVHEYPHQLSGGMRQRAMIAMAIVCTPELLIADEPTTALDVTVQAQIFDLLKTIQRDTDSGMILITHDMGAIAEMADRVVVMYAGRAVESGPVRRILKAPGHPYTQGLIRCVPHLRAEIDEERAELEEIPGMVPALSEIGAGCAFADRCPFTMERCRTETPPNFVLGQDSAARNEDDSEEHRAACWLHEETATARETVR
jgi:peptide/nickel transport system ATP-binding protein